MKTIRMKKVVPLIFAIMFILSTSGMASAYTSPNPWMYNNPTDHYYSLVGANAPNYWLTLDLPDWYHDQYTANKISLFTISMGGKYAYDNSIIDAYLRDNSSDTTPTFLGSFHPLDLSGSTLTSFTSEWNILTNTNIDPSYFDGLASFQIGYACHFTVNWNQVDIAYSQVPEPTTMLLLGLGLIGLAGIRRKIN
jgi:hypothetical protein